MTRTPKEADRLRSELADLRAKAQTLAGQIRNREGRLRRIAADAYGEQSEPIDGITIEVRDVELGDRECEASAIGVCVYSRLGREMSIPGQLERKGDATCTDACLFCGTINQSRWR